MFDITGEDIARLSDADLRTLVALLCEAELRARGLPTSCVTWGGHQAAPDGGIDVRVALPPNTVIDGFVPRPASGFQVKKQDMPRSEILGEMRPHGSLRVSIRELAEQEGAYVIVSAEGSTADSALTDRRNAMTEAIANLPTSAILRLDFYDRTRLASWVRNHAGLVAWVREKSGRPLREWRAFGAWAYPQEGMTADYLLDDELRIKTGKHGEEAGLGALAGIEQIRDRLRQPRAVVRLVGLSGVGKTRLVQVLFDERVGTRGLDPALAIYTNVADEPDPQPVGMVSDLIALRMRAIVVVDNCPPELHRRLTDVARSPESMVSVITVEYDVRDDQPEDTDVFALEPSSEALITKLLERRFPVLSQIDAGTIARFSGGNARIAVALAARVGRGESLAGLSDDVLFRRLFEQRNDASPALYLAAQACSIVYSFDGDNTSTDGDAELFRVGLLVGQPPEELFGHTAELHRRDLMQARGPWRAVLPHAIASRLATAALQNIPPATIQTFLRGAPLRLLRSFSRRLGYLDSVEAQRIVKEWLGVDGLLADPAALNEDGRAMLQNVAPVSPQETLFALERAFGDPESSALESAKQYLDLLRSLAYDPALFVRCANLLVKISRSLDVADRSRQSVNAFVSLFYLYLSGTHATIEQRLQVIEPLLRSADPKENKLGVLALSASLEVIHFTSGFSFEFGTQSRDHGSWPRSRADIERWFGAALALTQTIACSDGPCAAGVRGVLAEKFRWLWMTAGLHSELESVCREIAARQFWPQGWVAARRTLDLARKEEPKAEHLLQLAAIEALLRPTNLVQRVRSIVLSMRSTGIDFDDYDGDDSDDISAKIARTEASVYELGSAVGGDDKVLGELLPELVASEGQLWPFGRGLYAGTKNPVVVWERLTAALSVVPFNQQRTQVLSGFLYELNLHDPVLANALLDDAVSHEALGVWYPMLQTVTRLDEQGVTRVLRSLAVGKAPIDMYRSLAGGRATEPLSGEQVKRLVLAIAEKGGGYDIAADILSMRLHSDQERKQPIPGDIVEAGCALINQLAIGRTNPHEEYNLESIIKSCLVGDQGATAINHVCERLKRAINNRETYAFQNDGLLNALFRAQPLAALNGLCGGDHAELTLGVRILADIRSRATPLDVIPDDALLAWCDEDSVYRYPAMASVITIAAPATDGEPLRWSSIARSLLERAPDQVEVLKQLIGQFTPGGWSGSLASRLEAKARLLDHVPKAQPATCDFIEQERARWTRIVEEERQRESNADRIMDARFE